MAFVIFMFFIILFGVSNGDQFTPFGCWETGGEREEKGVRIFSKLFWILGMEDLPPLSNVLGLGLI